jgi:hypothetical protein
MRLPLPHRILIGVVSSLIALNISLRLRPAWAQSNDIPCRVDDETFVSVGGGCQDQATSRIWYGWHTAATFSWARDACNALVAGASADWRLPTVAELQELSVNEALVLIGSQPYLKHVSTYMDARAYFWTGQVKGNSAWAVRLTDGDAALFKVKPASAIQGILCVR